MIREEEKPISSEARIEKLKYDLWREKINLMRGSEEKHGALSERYVEIKSELESLLGHPYTETNYEGKVKGLSPILNIPPRRNRTVSHDSAGSATGLDSDTTSKDDDAGMKLSS